MQNYSKEFIFQTSSENLAKIVRNDSPRKSIAFLWKFKKFLIEETEMYRNFLATNPAQIPIQSTRELQRSIILIKIKKIKKNQEKTKRIEGGKRVFLWRKCCLFYFDSMVQHRKLPIERSKEIVAFMRVHTLITLSFLKRKSVREREEIHPLFPHPLSMLPERDRPLIKVTRMCNACIRLA